MPSEKSHNRMKRPRYAYGDMLLFGAFAAILGYEAAEWIGSAVGIVAVIVAVVAITELGKYPGRPSNGQ